MIVTVTLNAALHVAYTHRATSGLGDDPAAEGIAPVSRPAYRAGGRGVTVARVLRAFGHDVLAAGPGRRRVRRAHRPGPGQVRGADGVHADPGRVPPLLPVRRSRTRRSGAAVLRTGPYITTEELGRFAADYRRLMAGAAAVVLCGSLPDGLDADTYGSLVTYAVEAGVPVILDAGGEELKHAVGHGPDLVVAESSAAEPGPAGSRRRPGPAGRGRGRRRGRGHGPRGDRGRRVDRAPRGDGRRGPGACLPHGPGRAGGGPGARPAARLVLAGPAQACPGPGRGGRPWTREPGNAVERDRVDLAAYERLLDAVRVEPSCRGYLRVTRRHSECVMVGTRLSPGLP